jgi:hypothetical protein
MRDFHQPPFVLGKRRRIGGLVGLHIDELSVEAIGPAVVRAVKGLGVALVVTADPHAAMAAGVQEHADALVLVAREDDRLLAHA